MSSLTDLFLFAFLTVVFGASCSWPSGAQGLGVGLLPSCSARGAAPEAAERLQPGRPLLLLKPVGTRMPAGVLGLPAASWQTLFALCTHWKRRRALEQAWEAKRQSKGGSSRPPLKPLWGGTGETFSRSPQPDQTLPAACQKGHAHRAIEKGSSIPQPLQLLTQPPSSSAPRGADPHRSREQSGERSGLSCATKPSAVIHFCWPLKVPPLPHRHLFLSYNRLQPQVPLRKHRRGTFQRDPGSTQWGGITPFMLLSLEGGSPHKGAALPSLPSSSTSLGDVT